MVKDQQRKACQEQVWVRVCTCEDGVRCGKQGGNDQPIKGVRLGPAGTGSIVQAALLLLLCKCCDMHPKLKGVRSITLNLCVL